MKDIMKALQSGSGYAPMENMTASLQSGSVGGAGAERNIDLLSRAMQCWGRLEDFRMERDRCKRFTYGDQWGDRIPVDGEQVREEDYIRSQGNVPLKNNLIRRLVRNVLGVFRSRWEVPEFDGEETGVERERLQRLLARNMRLNRMEEIYARTMEEFLISGVAIHRKWFGRRGGKCDCWTDFVQPDNFFVDRDARDFRNWDVGMVGEIHDMDFDSLCAGFATGPDDCRRLGEIYGKGFGQESGSERDCRVWEIWHKEYRQRYRCHDVRKGRVFVCDAGRAPDDPDIRKEWVTEEEWVCHYLSPQGDILRSGKSPYAHKGHPYVFRMYPFVDGEIHSFVGDIIDQQKFTNRLISMYDWILRASSKGVLLFPEGSLPEGADINDVAEEWSRFNGVIVYRPKAGMPLPQQVSSNSANKGITELLNIQMKMMEDISGVNGALQGRLENGSVSGTLYSQQTENSMTALADLFRSFECFISDATEMDMSNLREFYGSK